MAVSISQVTFEHHVAALGIAETSPRISWRFEGNATNWEQSSFDIEVLRQGRSSVVHSVNSSQSLLVPWPDEPLGSAEQAQVRTRAHSGSCHSTPWSDWVTVETGLLSDDDWAEAAPIVADRETEIGEPKRPVYFRKEFSLKAIKSARLYITALGIYEAEINGQRVGDYVLAPGWQSYNYRHVYDTYDVTGMLKDGHNAIGVVVGEGWFVGRLGFGGGSREHWGDTLGVLSLLTVTLEDGSLVRISTDGTWQASTGPVVQATIYDGETYDSRLEADFEGWSSPSFAGEGWISVKTTAMPKGKLSSPDGPPTRKVEERKVQQIFKSPSGKTLLDFGQNLVGWLKLTVEGPEGTELTLKHAEVLENGELSLRPLRQANATDHLILHGKGSQTWEPRFTFHGFRYAQIDGWPENTPLTEESVTAIVVHSDLEQTGWFECSHELLNKFHSNVRWSMKGNFLSIPTDCPQRDERLGWTGDAHAFGPTSNFLYNTAGFWRGWHRDVWSEMQRNNSMIVPFYVPTLPPNAPATPAAVWGDVAVANPWNLYRAFGDVGLLKEQSAQAQAWVDTGISRNEVGLWNRSSFQFADWLDPKAPSDSPGQATTAPILVADAYLIRMTEILADMADVLGDDAKAEEYRKQHTSLLAEFQKAWITDGEMANRTQTAYAMGIEFGIFTEDQLDSAAETLRAIVSENDYLVGTGFAGTPTLGPALQRIEAVEDFYKMLLQTKVPSWLYQVVMNGTTTWERWDSLLPNGTVNPGEMTSFNHYAFGAVSDWIHRTIGGLAPAEPGWKKIAVEPIPGGGITRADTRYVSGYGEVRAKWWVESGEFYLNLWVPPNTKAVVKLPRADKSVEVGSGFHEYHEEHV
ncbi:Alpha-L-rhamnosidase [Paramyrothecium foliicola]|nr:Alpha-L-rhamnosidase [Paramyrothecium foliicola]